MAIITLTTDFGEGSHYVAAMKGVILSINPAATLVDITHRIPPQDIRAAALVLDDVIWHFPPETIHVAVIDPGVGTARALVYAELGPQRLLAPDNGLFGPLVERHPPALLVRLARPEFWLAEVSNTFHGRDILAPVAARLSAGVDPRQLGPIHPRVLPLDLPSVEVAPHRIDGLVQAIDSFGNLITNIGVDLLAGRPTDRRACVVCNIFETWGIYRTYGDQPDGSLVALVGSSGRLELAVVGGNAADALGVSVGARVTIGWET